MHFLSYALSSLLCFSFYFDRFILSLCLLLHLPYNSLSDVISIDYKLRKRCVSRNFVFSV